MEGNRIHNRVLYMNLGTRMRGRLRNRLQDEVREDGRIVGEGWQEKVHNREERKKLLRMVRNRHILHMPMEWMNVSFQLTSLHIIHSATEIILCATFLKQPEQLKYHTTSPCHIQNNSEPELIDIVLILVPMSNPRWQDWFFYCIGLIWLNQGEQQNLKFWPNKIKTNYEFW